VLLYEMIAGALPYEATTLGSLSEKIKKAEYLSPSVLNHAVPREIEAIIAKCLRRHPADRYTSAAELGRDLEQLDNREAKPVAHEEHFAARLEPFLENFLPHFKSHWQPQMFTSLLNRVGKLKPVVLCVPFLVLVLLLNLFSWSDDKPIPPQRCIATASRLGSHRMKREPPPTNVSHLC
jgi:serine/threonine protein kinase